MAFTNAETLCLHLGFESAPEWISEALVQQAIDEAHNDLMRDIKSEYEESDDPVLIQAETELASACLLRCLANQFSVNESEVETPMLKVLGGAKLKDLVQRAEKEEKAGRGRLMPFLEVSNEGFEFGLVEGRKTYPEEKEG